MDMDKVFQKLFDRALGWSKGPALSVLMVLVVIALVRHPPGRLP
jgi:hypothetical protein